VSSSHAPFYLAGWLAAMLMLTSTAFAQNKTQCSCPSIKADGFGSSSCSANESSQRCRIEYNQFAQTEVAKVEQIFSNAGIKVRGFDGAPNMPPHQANTVFATTLSGDQIAEAILVYMAVAAARDDSFSASDARDLHRAVIGDFSRKNKVITAFNAEAFNAGSRTLQGSAPPKPLNVERMGDLVTSTGCASVRAGGKWYMYKAFWSPARHSPQCE
jgi:hypothetical protein